jgi:hypothetical protein
MSGVRVGILAQQLIWAVNCLLLLTVATQGCIVNTMLNKILNVIVYIIKTKKG